MSRLATLGALAAAVLAVAGCGKTVIDDAKTEATIEQDLERSTGQKVDSVDCPSGVEVTKGATFQCTIVLKNGTREVATLKIRNEDADLSLTKLEQQGKSEK